MKLNAKIISSISVVIFSLLLVPAVFAIDWPSDNGRVLHNFGWNDKGQPSLFHSFESEGAIRSADSGEIIFINDTEHMASSIPSPLGSWMAIEQGDGLIGIYSRFENREDQAISNIVEQGVILAFSGMSGWSERNGFSFTLYDSKENRWVNPAMIFPVLLDTRAPVIQQVLLVAPDGRTINPATQRVLPQGQYKILVDAVDTLNANQNPLAVHRISCMVNGVESGVMHMETFSGQNGKLMTYRRVSVPADQAYVSYPSYEVGEVLFNRGQAVLEIIVHDVADNSRNAVFRLTVE
ncbi:MAG: hypothetical protein LBV20_07240 [Treponema sp.]|jgi:hypothetical protein|nr:hypothetical protein [Treponema sp.]